MSGPGPAAGFEMTCLLSVQLHGRCFPLHATVWCAACASLLCPESLRARRAHESDHLY